MILILNIFIINRIFILGTTIVCVGAGHDLMLQFFRSQLQEFASDPPEQYVLTKGFEELDKVVKSISSITCEGYIDCSVCKSCIIPYHRRATNNQALPPNTKLRGINLSINSIEKLFSLFNRGKESANTSRSGKCFS